MAKSTDRFEKTYGPERAKALRFALADIFTDEFAEALLQDHTSIS
ncbi:hypothetical protein [Undibacterium sp. TC9W]